MNLVIRKCSICGGNLKESGDALKCEYCDSVFDIKTADADNKKILELLDETKQEKLSNARQNLYKAAHEKYLSKEKIRNAVKEVKTLYPVDFMASFYDCLINDDKTVLNEFLVNIDLNKYADFKDEVIEATIKSLDYKNAICLKNFVDLTCSVNERNKYNTEIERIVEEFESGAYNLDIDRDFFICYSSKDMKEVIRIVDYLESNGLTCFVALRNLRHGVGSQENYKKSLEKAMRNSKALIYISSENSRDMGCDALRFELPYLKDELKKKPRIEYLIEDYGKKTTQVAKTFIKQVFDGLEWCKSLEDLTSRASSIVFGKEEETIEDETDRKSKLDPSSFKYCLECCASNELDSKFCKSCGSKEFVKNGVELVSIYKERAKLAVKEKTAVLNEKITKLKETNDKELKDVDAEIIKEKETLENKAISLKKTIETFDNALLIEKRKRENEINEIEKKNAHKSMAALEREKKQYHDDLRKRAIDSRMVILDEEHQTAWFGSYPRSLTCNEQRLQRFKDIKFDPLTWKEFTYSKYSKSGPYAFYTDIEVDGIKQYRGVYLTKFRPYSDHNFADTVGENYKKGVIYWFDYDKIEWDILKSDKENELFLVSKHIIDYQSYDIFEPDSVNPKSYECSNIREWLNDDFYNTAFDEEEKKIIKLCRLKNNTQFVESNSTIDYCFLLSQSELEYKYGKRRRASFPTQYALSQTNMHHAKTHNEPFMLRTSKTDYKISICDREGEVSYGLFCCTEYGIKPAIKIEF